MSHIVRGSTEMLEKQVAPRPGLATPSRRLCGRDEERSKL
jgi:hypothetical protein